MESENISVEAENQTLSSDVNRVRWGTFNPRSGRAGISVSRSRGDSFYKIIIYLVNKDSIKEPCLESVATFFPSSTAGTSFIILFINVYIGRFYYWKLIHINIVSVAHGALILIFSDFAIFLRSILSYESCLLLSFSTASIPSLCLLIEVAPGLAFSLSIHAWSIPTGIPLLRCSIRWNTLPLSLRNPEEIHFPSFSDCSSCPFPDLSSRLCARLKLQVKLQMEGMKPTYMLST